VNKITELSPKLASFHKSLKLRCVDTTVT